MLEKVFTTTEEKCHSLQGPKQLFEFVTADSLNPSRHELEQYISQGFESSYNAHLTNFLPLLLGVKNKQLRAAVGVRRASSALFIEQYFDQSITSVLSSVGIHSERFQIAEMGNLYSQSARFTLPLIMTVVMGLFLSEVRYLVFSATDKVRELLMTLGFPMHFLAEARIERLCESTDDWGTYYEHQPKVMVLDIEASIKVAYQRRELHGLMAIVQNNAYQLIEPMRRL